MPIPQTKLFLPQALATGGAVRLTPVAPGDFALTVTGVPAAPWIARIGDLNGDGRQDIVVGAPGDDDKASDAGRVFVLMNPLPGGSTVTVADGLTHMIIDGVNAGDRAGAAVGAVSDLNADGRAEVLVGAPGMDVGANADAGVGFVVWGAGGAASVDLGDPFNGDGKGFAIKGQAAGDAAGTTMLAIGDLNGDGKAEILIGAPGNDAGGADAGAAYVVWGRAGSSAVNLASVAAGTGGFRITGASGGDAVGAVLGAVGDLNGDGRAEILVGVPEAGSHGSHAGAVYVVFGQATGTGVNLANVAAGTGGFVINGADDDGAGAAVAGLGDVNGDGLADILVGAPRGDGAYVVFGKAGTAAVDLAAVQAGTGGFRIVAEAPGDLNDLSVTGGADLNRDGIADIVIGAPHAGEGGEDGGAVYVVWGGGAGTVDLGLIAQGMGGAKVVGASGSLLGASVAIGPDMDADGTPDLLIGAPGLGESAYALAAPASWQPDVNVYGTDGDDVIGAGYGGAHQVGATADNIVAAGGNDSIAAGAGNDVLDGGTGDDAMAGGTGDDTYYVDSAGDGITELPGEGTDTVIAEVDYTLPEEVEALQLTGFARSGTGNAAANTITGTSGDDRLDGAAGADTLAGGLGSDTYVVDDAGDSVQEAPGGGFDTIESAIDLVLPANVEALVLTGAARLGTGNGLANTLTGTAFDDTLDGGAGADAMAGGAGDDTYLVDAVGDSVIEAASGGHDTVRSTIDLTLGAQVEDLVLLGAARHGTGNALANTLTGTGFADTLDGGAGADTMRGGLGDDTYLVDDAADAVEETGGTDTVVARVDYTLGAGVERLELAGAARHGTGNAGDNTLVGTGFADTLDGGAGADTLQGGAGDDRYIVDDAGDSVTELAGGGTDTVVAAVDVTLGAEVERLELSGTSSIGTGNALDNLLTGAAGHQVLRGAAGHDTLDGGAGADTMEGGTGDDTFIIDDAGDVVIEAAGEGTDTVVAAFDLAAMPANVENLRLSGTAHTATGNGDSNRLSGGSGDDTLDGAGGDDLLLGGDGDDTLVSRAGHDALSGGSGDDRYVVAGGRVEIEDFLGHDTIDASEGSGNNSIDLSGETESEIEGEICHFGLGGSTASPIDVQFLQDLSGSFGDDITTVRSLVPGILGALRAVQADSLFGVTSFIDKPVSPFGVTGEWVYQLELSLGSSATALTSTYGALAIHSGADEPEAQIESLMQVALHATETGFRPDSAHFVVLFTDAPFHRAGDGAAGGITTPNNGDALTPGNGAQEDYPLVGQVRTALEAANIIPIFAIANNYGSVYQGLVTDLGRGAVVTLTADSSNIIAALTAGLTAATTTRIEDALGGSGDDTLTGNGADNALTGGGGHDVLSGRAGNDRLEGGEGTDTAVFSGARAGYAIALTGTGATVTGADGTDTLLGIERLAFADGTVELAALSASSFAIARTGPGTVLEGSGGSTAMSFTITRSGALDLAQQVDWAVAGAAGPGTVAADAADFATGILPGGTLSFAAGQASGIVTVAIAGDLVGEYNERFAVTLANPSLGATLGTASAQAVILNDDTSYAIRALDAGKPEGSGGTTAFTFTVSRRGVGGVGTVEWQVAGAAGTGTVAANAADFAGGVLPGGILTFGAGETSRTITVDVAADQAGEFNERFAVTLANPSGGAMITTASAGALILNDDTSVSLRTPRLVLAEGNAGTTNFAFTVSRDGTALGSAASVDWVVAAGSAPGTVSATGGDFIGGVLPSGTVSFAAGETSRTITVAVAGDTAGEAALNESFALALGNASPGVAILAGTAVGVILDDDRIIGTAGDDTLVGTAGPDVFLIGSGQDSITGGAGTDLFLFQPAALSAGSAATFLDFAPASGERLDLSRIDAIAGTLANDAFTFIGAAAFSGAPGELRWEDQGAVRAILGNLEGTAAPEFTLFLALPGPVSGDWLVL